MTWNLDWEKLQCHLQATILSLCLETCAYPLPEPHDLFQASQMKFEDFQKDLRKLRRDLTGKVTRPHSPDLLLKSLDARLLPARLSLQLPLTVTPSFLELSTSFSVKPKPGEKEASPNTLFGLWHEFSTDFKEQWKKQNKLMLKERLKMAEECFKQAKEKASYNVKPKHATGIVRRPFSSSEFCRSTLLYLK
uniref:FH2 domain-containing protein n=1 Tax=Hippocampus comes TaxID=109280 RepID=A0A3Q2Y8F2_HIPCM